MTDQQWIGVVLLVLSLGGFGAIRAYLYGFGRGLRKGVEIGRGGPCECRNGTEGDCCG